VNRHPVSYVMLSGCYPPEMSDHLRHVARSHAPVRLSPVSCHGADHLQTSQIRLRNCARGHHYIQNESLGGDLKLIIINHAIICRRNWNLVSTYLGRREDNWVTADWFPCAWRRSPTEGNGTNRVRRHGVRGVTLSFHR
jgi:hypothetical protein